MIMNISGLEVNSPEYWEIRHKRDHWTRHSGWVMPLLARLIPQEAELLIVGVGQGGEAFKLLELRPDLKSITAFDVSPTAIEKAKAAGSRAEFICEDVFNLKNKWRGRSFDYVVSIQNFEHWPVELHALALRNIWCRIKPGGKFFFTGVGRAWDLGTMNEGPMAFEGKTIFTPNDYHYCNWSEQDLYDLLMTQQASSVKFWRLRRQNRVVAEGEKSL